ncbi:hypothetical protein O0L34_g9831 [Tuta absoluta]|nr:hypothetical protein O0L34_g9831 [Tuta absoluta]
MLTRLRFKRDFRLVVRCLSDKPSDSDGNPTDTDQKTTSVAEKKAADSTEKIQQLLKSMMTAQPKISESEYEKKFTVAKDRRRKEKADDEIERKTEKIEESLTKAAGEVAQAIGGNTKQTEAELLSKVLGKINQTSTSLSDLIIGMKVDRTKESTDDLTPRETRGQQVKRLTNKARVEKDQAQTRFSQRRERPGRDDRQGRDDRREGFVARKGTVPQPTTVDIFSGSPLGIFAATEPNYGTKLEVWEHLKQRELHLATAQPPANYFDKMTLWTEQGKVWRFPIDNEQGMEEEQNVHFSEHIFLDAHLEGWCPKKGPIRHFMELVCVGLSKNAFYTVKEKKDHIMWYKEYFESKKEVLTEVGAWEQTAKSSKAST